MKAKQSDIIIIGAGLTGLTLAYLLKQTKKTVIVLEARDRLGGRIYTTQQQDCTTQEMGATWLGQKHSFLIDLLEELEIGVFEQTLSDRAIFEPISTSPHQLVKLPPNTDPSYRIKGGSSTLIERLANTLEKKQIYTGEVVQKIVKNGEELSVQTATQNFTPGIVISTLPPYLFTKTIKVEPELPVSLLDIAEKTHTWMGESIKIALAYKSPFWRAAQYSGTIFSNVGPIPEMYDHSNFEDSHFALKGFLNSSYFSLTKEERLELVLQQLRKYFGSQVEDFLTYEEAVWRKEDFTFFPYETHILPHQNNGHAIYQKTWLDGKLIIAGSETAMQHPGYMEGAVRSAKFVHSIIENPPSNTRRISNG